MFRLASYLSPQRLDVIDAPSKSSAMLQTLELFRESPYLVDFDVFCEEIFQREDVLATGVGFGVGVPHIRSATVREPVAALTVLREGVDYGSIDGIPVNIIVMIGMPEGANELYLRYLSKITMRFQHADFRKQVGGCQDKEELCRIISMA